MPDQEHKKIEQSIDDLARITKQGFDEMHQFRQETNENFTRVNARLDLLERDVSDIYPVREVQ